MAEELSVIGKEKQHDKQIVDIVTGRLDYAADILPGKKLFTRFLCAPHAHANIKSIDISKALSLDGVEAICTHQDCPVFSERILYWGQEVAAVAAINEAIASQAIDLIQVEYEPLSFVLDPDEAMQPQARRFCLLVTKHPGLNYLAVFCANAFNRVFVRYGVFNDFPWNICL